MENNLTPTISVIIPLYNREKLVKRAIESVLKQSYSDFELIIVDDCSTDNSANIVKSIDDKRILYISHDTNKGANAARNTGIRLAKGKYIAFQDSDDEWLPSKLKKQIELMKNSSEVTAVVYTGFWRVRGHEKIYRPYKGIKNLQGNILDELLKGNFISTQTILIRQSALNKVGLFDDTLARMQDWELVIRLAENYEFKYINEALVNVYHTSDSITANFELYGAALEQIIQKHIKYFSRNKKNLSKLYYDAGSYLCVNKDFKTGQIFFKKALSADIFNLKCLLKLLLVSISKRCFIRAQHGF